ncbi:OmpW/AlkL family protein [Roseateles amylovorans]|uniref:Outer membrane beta-barrel protein n=1 Tax=Roseateles amylovorans TaxID=2978473 RepID=A0ABY6B735_9BURK|nr:OmpW family outer membrane protein [Roseateles amylovorans]UXH79025.1 outer membrane beta-barrel protein [Roseateles amylovorans]
MARFQTRTLPQLIAAAALVALTAQVHAQTAGSGPFQVRVRAVSLDPADKDSTGLGLKLSKKTIPEVDFTYFFTPNLATELVLTYPQKHKLSAGGTQIGTVKHLPPTLSLQYHFNPEGQFRPYVGAGINYTRFSGVHFNPAVQAALSPSIKRNSFGFSAQVGADVMIDRQWSVNFDVKKVQIDTKVYSANTEVGKFKIDPLLLSVGVGYRF